MIYDFETVSWVYRWRVSPIVTWARLVCIVTVTVLVNVKFNAQLIQISLHSPHVVPSLNCLENQQAVILARLSIVHRAVAAIGCEDKCSSQDYGTMTLSSN